MLKTNNFIGLPIHEWLTVRLKQILW
jgi:hypothetical protein